MHYSHVVDYGTVFGVPNSKLAIWTVPHPSVTIWCSEFYIHSVQYDALVQR